MINELKNFKLSNFALVLIICLYLFSTFFYEYFVLVSVLFFIFIFNFKSKNLFTKTNINLIKFFPIYFYIVRIIKIFLDQNRSIFWDMQLFLFMLNFF